MNTKSLKDEVADVLSATTNKAAKKAALIQLGVTPYEIALLLEGAPATVSDTLRFTFGVEIECFVAPGAIHEAAATTHLRYDYERYNHDTRAHFKFVSDASVRGLSNPIECVSPVLRGKKGLADLKRVCKTLNKADAKVNQSCGLHVHIGAANLTDNQYCNVFVNYLYLEEIIDTFMAQSRRDNQYAATLSQHASAIKRATTKSDIAYALGSRYFKVNPYSYTRHKTIEFRQHGGTTNYDKISHWVMFCGKLVNWSMNNRLNAPVSNIDDIPFLNDEEKAFFKSRQSELA